jgi:hypothetical protein
MEALGKFVAEIRPDTSIARSIMVSLLWLPSSRYLEAYIKLFIVDNEDRKSNLSKARHRF